MNAELKSPADHIDEFARYARAMADALEAMNVKGQARQCLGVARSSLLQAASQMERAWEHLRASAAAPPPEGLVRIRRD